MIWNSESLQALLLPSEVSIERKSHSLRDISQPFQAMIAAQMRNSGRRKLSLRSRPATSASRRKLKPSCVAAVWRA